ncbi:hypothetical protein [Gemmobacter serpentinus]|uniref:hypothetical protein n=1 Tax=Gemmobacter serpentinus TaxID=2652247 RepID=UPI00124D4130|nr:hypothetical protein [Gemmobacter serpentinus]
MAQILGLVVEFGVAGISRAIYGTDEKPQPLWRRALLHLFILGGAAALILPFRSMVPNLLWLVWGFAVFVMLWSTAERWYQRLTRRGRWW